MFKCFEDLLKKSGSIFLLLALAHLLVACGGGVTGDPDNFLEVQDQTLLDLEEITIRQVSLQEDAWIVVYESDLLGSLGETILGRKNLSAGEYENTTIVIDRPVNNNEFLFVELRKDAGAIGVYEPLTTDLVISQAATTAVRFQVTYSSDPYLQIADQEVFENSLTVSKVVSNQAAWLVAHRFDANAANNLGAVIGTQKLGEENSELPIHVSNIKISLNSVVLSVDDIVLLTLYKNSSVFLNGDNFDSVEDTLITLNAEPVISQIAIMDESELCDDCTTFELTANGNLAYIWESVDSNTGEKTTINNSDINLEVGNRYVIRNTVRASHPLVLLNNDNEILLSQNAPGSFDSDLDVNQVRINNELHFTLTEELAAQLSSYECAYHPQMNGDFVISP